MPKPARRGRPRGWYVTRAAIAALAAALAVLLVLLVVRNGDASQAADRIARSYRPPSFSAPVQVQRIVSVIGDGTTTNASTGWPAGVAISLRLTSFVQSLPGGGYVKVSDRDTTTFADASSQVAPGARVVAFVGGVADRGANRFQLTQAVTVALAEAHRIAPNARIVVVGPLWEGEPPADVLAASDAVSSAAEIAGVEFVDPIAEDWAPEGAGYLNDSGTRLTAAGQRAIEQRMQKVLRPLLADPS